MPRWLYWILLAYATGMVLTIIAFRNAPPAAQSLTNYFEWPRFWVRDPHGMWNSFQYGLGIKNMPTPGTDAVIPPIEVPSGSQVPAAYGANGQVAQP